MRALLVSLSLVITVGAAHARPCPPLALGKPRPLPRLPAALPRGDFDLQASDGLVRTAGATLDLCGNRWIPDGSAPLADGTLAMVASGPGWRLGLAPTGSWRLDRAGWHRIVNGAAPAPRLGGVVATIGDQVVVWGGDGPGGPVVSGARYDVAHDRWTPMATAGAPRARLNPAWGVVAGRLLVWGGEVGAGGRGGPIADGALYDPATDTWTALPTAGAPTEALGVRVLTDGDTAVVWGQFRGVGARLELASLTWRPLPALPTGAGDVAVSGGRLYATASKDLALYRLDRDAWAPVSPPTTDGPPWLRWPSTDRVIVARIAPRAAVAMEVAVLGVDDRWTVAAVRALPAPPTARPGTVEPEPPMVTMGPPVVLDRTAVHVFDAAAARWRRIAIPRGPWWRATVQDDRVVVWGKATRREQPVMRSCGCEGVREPGAPGCDPMMCPGIELVTDVAPGGYVARWR